MKQSMLERLHGASCFGPQHSLRNSGTSDGVEKAWATRRAGMSAGDKVKVADDARHSSTDPKAFAAHTASLNAWSATEKADSSGSVDDHAKASRAHYNASKATRPIDSALAKEHDAEYLRHADKLKSMTPKAVPAKNPYPTSTRAGNRWASIERGSDD